MKFETAVEIILHHEGGYVFNPKDPGGETKFGISKRAYPHLDIKNLTKDQAKAIYERHYWGVLGIENLPGALRLMVFDCAVNQGPSAAIGLLQTLIGAKVDGVLGPNTLQKINDFSPFKIIEGMAKLRWNRYQMAKNFEAFSGGWAARLLDISFKCLGQIIEGQE